MDRLDEAKLELIKEFLKTLDQFFIRFVEQCLTIDLLKSLYISDRLELFLIILL
ncbi:hypothetical protein P255_02672 [Acinetobacter brisouii CIP 110357]|uniref:Uncharacterized protein n=1 Tax=Acinetobacter brisouii CIP 110357 TaxID=1341683 RepID=V2VR39_9GAMM|nr:hypothetical protein F954_00047 [Acinetobacter brisouii ANC 4119]ESK50174.1 hypothetical protein P255_02672 [Acinetobacter brisouii CIP 110357]